MISIADLVCQESQDPIRSRSQDLYPPRNDIYKASLQPRKLAPPPLDIALARLSGTPGAPRVATYPSPSPDNRYDALSRTMPHGHGRTATFKTAAIPLVNRSSSEYGHLYQPHHHEPAQACCSHPLSVAPSPSLSPPVHASSSCGRHSPRRSFDLGNQISQAPADCEKQSSHIAYPPSPRDSERSFSSSSTVSESEPFELSPSTPVHHHDTQKDSADQEAANAHFAAVLQAAALEHYREGKVNCPDCGKDFHRLCNFRSHFRIHQRTRPFVCKVCSQQFLRKHDLNRHERIHAGEKPFRCRRCGKGFVRKDALRRHENMIPEIQKFRCVVKTMM
ncbi:uncharacterized protein SPPG_08955 [Spizellomyces punctatus DAOM BR117]|uniref:C2H2-type domain-containing protein n=1 Tax=Spizellomyces punctatus (strain DAOM BR117) TaxID=645134 RepID=A0A0L0HML6_SPIPD|nr:uncharacterized protein SPPG_08955 [Spizellomyces punctatus DAOM BR117]KND02661.1 hypothetical protein SPPG_08955 [Spizellomyces punctatus DAOM BR117]|eukprot:XP_016610700.1 hypothetical protein SPPG_08955 [Spizellomyces punctatus DAOM BR117]